MRTLYFIRNIDTGKYFATDPRGECYMTGEIRQAKEYYSEQQALSDLGEDYYNIVFNDSYLEIVKTYKT